MRRERPQSRSNSKKRDEMSSLHVCPREDHTICDDHTIRGRRQSVCEEQHTNRTKKLVRADVHFVPLPDIDGARPMSAMGQKQTRAPQLAMSAMGEKRPLVIRDGDKM